MTLVESNSNGGNTLREAKSAAMSGFLPKSHISRRFREWSETQLCDEFLQQCCDFASAHFASLRTVQLATQRRQHVTRRCDCLERYKKLDAPGAKCEEFIAK